MPWPVLLMARELDQGGSERQLSLVARSLDRSRFEPWAGCLRPTGLRVLELERDGVPIQTFPVHSFRSPSAVIGAVALARFIRHRGIRLVHTFDYPLNVFALPVTRGLSRAVALASQRSHRELIPAVYRRAVAVTDRLAHGIVVNCNYVRRHLEENEHVPASRIHVCPNGIDLVEFHARREGRPAGLLASDLVIGTVCALRPEKGLPTLIEAFARLRGRVAAKLLIVGSGPMLGPLKTQARAARVAGDCVFVPAADNVADWLRAIDIFVLPSRSEAFSNSLMEAMACGCAVVASRVGGNPELVRDGDTGLSFPVDDAVALAAVIDRLARDPALRCGLARSGTRYINDHFSARAAAARMGEIYAGFIERRRRA